jgi:hypothetical protein
MKTIVVVVVVVAPSDSFERSLVVMLCLELVMQLEFLGTRRVLQFVALRCMAYDAT